jgi:hypothetical protein
MNSDGCQISKRDARGAFLDGVREILSSSDRILTETSSHRENENEIGLTPRRASVWAGGQRDNGIDSVDGRVELATRDKYAALHDLPLPGSGRVEKEAGPDQKSTCVDVCAEFTGIRECRTRCAPDARDKKHACREACQTAFGSACDRAFPASGEGGSTNFKICLSYTSASCEDTCGKFQS